MRLILLFVVALAYSDEGPTFDKNVDLEVSLFGLSYHSNTDYDWNQVNQGAGLGVVIGSNGDKLRFVLCGGTYKDSFNKQAIYVLGGLRCMLGDDHGFHHGINILTGFLNGSNTNGATFLPVYTVGYDWFDFCVTADPFNKDRNNTNRDGEVVPESKTIACFINLRVCRF